MKVRDCIDRDLGNEPQGVIRVYQQDTLRTDINEYVLTDTLAKEFGKVLERIIDASGPTAQPTDKTGIWVSGFFGSGKSHFAKLAGHLLANTDLGGQTARDLFKAHLHHDRPSDERLRELFQQATTYHLCCHLVAFDITALDSAAADRNVAITFLRAFYNSLGLSKVIVFAERELELQAAGKYQEFLNLYPSKAGVTWNEDRDLTSSSALFAECLTELLPHRYSTVDLAHQSLELALRNVDQFYDVDTVIDFLLRWLDAKQKSAGSASQRLLFVADEVGGWAGSDLRRIEQLRTLVEGLGSKGQGRIWLMVTSQEKLSAVVQNTTDDRAYLQRLEARFRTNIHLESSEVGAVIEDRILRKKPTAYPQLENLWTAAQPLLRDIAESPGIELGANYPRPDKNLFLKSYPFLPYQLPAAADIFGGMRGIKVSSGARSMIKVAFDATHSLADQEIGALVTWDQIFDSANRDNEFSDEQYLGSQGVQYLLSADIHVTGVPLSKPSRLLKILWLIGKSGRIPRTVKNLARFLTADVSQDVLRLEQDVTETLDALSQRDFVRQEAATGQWKFLTQDEVTVEKIVKRIAEEDLKARDVRKEISSLYSQRLQSLFNGKITHGKSNTPFAYGLFLENEALKNEDAPVQLKVFTTNTVGAEKARETNITALEEPVVFWLLDQTTKLEGRIRRAIAIESLPNDKEFRDKATAQTRAEADKLQTEAAQLREEAEQEVERIFQSGVLLYGGQEVDLHSVNGTAKAKIEAALRDRIEIKYTRFREGDLTFKSDNIEKLFTVPASDRAKLDPALALFSTDGHVNGNHVLVEALTQYLKSSMKNTGGDLIEAFGRPPFGWPSDLLRYTAAAMFVDAKLSALDKSGKRFDNPKEPSARALFGTAAFKTTHLDVEEDSLTPAESTQARTLLTDLGQKPVDGSEIALKEATQALATDLTKRISILERAHNFEFPLPESYSLIPGLIETISEHGSRVKVVRTLLANEQQLRDATTALSQLEKFDKNSGFTQYRRSQQLLNATLQAGLEDDASVGEKVITAHEQLDALRAQRRVLEEWNSAVAKYRVDLIDSFRDVYQPLRKLLAERIAVARAELTGMPEYQALPLGDKTRVRVQFLAEGKPLQEISVPDLQGDQQLLAANSEYSIAHLNASLAALDSQLAAAKTMVLELYGREMKRRGEEARTATWSPAKSFTGKRFESEAQVDEVFDPEKERIKALIRQGKSVQVI